MSSLQGKRYVAAFWLMVMGLICLAGLSHAADSAPPADMFKELKRCLIHDGIAREVVDRLYADPALTFNTWGAALFLRHLEANLDYDQFLSRANIERAHAYQIENAAIFSAAEEEYKVNAHIITAIILVETKLGTVLGKSHVAGMLSTLASLADPLVKETFWNAVKEKVDVSRDEYDNWVVRKAPWAYTELIALLTYTDREGIDPATIRGSYAGAFGIPQFIPTKALTLAVDGNADGRIDLFDHADAITSVANYLRSFGWRPGLSETDAAKVVFKYNHSDYYVRAILGVAAQLAGYKAP